VKHNLLRLSEAALDLELGVGSVVNAETFDELEGLVKLALLTDCRFLQAKHDFDLLTQPSYLAWWDGTVVPRLLVLESSYVTDDFAVQFTTIDYGRKPIATRCHIHHLATAVNARGEVCYCKRLRDRPEWSAGNLQAESLRQVVAGPLNLRLSAEVTPQNCGIVCPYMDLNELIAAISGMLPCRRPNCSRGTRTSSDPRCRSSPARERVDTGVQQRLVSGRGRAERSGADLCRLGTDRDRRRLDRRGGVIDQVLRRTRERLGAD
jgi:hypothetical protein